MSPTDPPPPLDWLIGALEAHSHAEAEPPAHWIPRAATLLAQAALVIRDLQARLPETARTPVDHWLSLTVAEREALRRAWAARLTPGAEDRLVLALTPRGCALMEAVHRWERAGGGSIIEWCD